MELNNKLELIKKLFIIRTDLYPNQDIDGWRRKFAKLTDDIILEHINETTTIGAYELSKDNKVIWGCIDFDGNLKEEFEKAKQIYLLLCNKGYKDNIVFEFSGNKGYHIWIFFEKNDAYKIRYFLEDIKNESGLLIKEIFPKQETTTQASPYGNFVKLPLSIHRKTGKKCLFYNDSFELLDLEKSWELLETKKQAKCPEYERRIKPKKEKREIKVGNKQHPCEALLRLLEQGVMEKSGEDLVDDNNVIYGRNPARRTITTAYLNLGYTKEEILSILLKFNEKCTPPDDEDEVEKDLEETIKRNDNYEVGCNNIYFKAMCPYSGKELDCDWLNPKIIEMEEIAKNMSLKELWNEYFENDIILQPEWRDILFFNLVADVLDERQDDLRIHAFLSCDSTSGKTEGITKVKKVLNKLDLKATSYITATDRNLIGSLDDNALKYNRKHLLTLADKDYMNPILYGTLYEHTLIAFPEAERILELGKWNQDTQNILRTTMDREREVSKGLGSEIIKYYTNTSFLFGCYPKLDAIKQILHTGLFQRMFFIHKTINRKEHKQIRKFMLKRNSSVFYLEKENIYCEELCVKLKELKERWEKNKIDFYNKFELSEENQKYIEEKMDELEDDYNFLSEQDLGDVHASERRSIILIYKVLKILSFLNNNDYSVTKKDIDFAVHLYKNSLRSMATVLNQTSYKDAKKKFVDNKVNGILNIIQNNEKISRTKLYELMKNNLNIKSPNKQVEIINGLIVNNFIKEEIVGKEKILTINED